MAVIAKTAALIAILLQIKKLFPPDNIYSKFMYLSFWMLFLFPNHCLKFIHENIYYVPAAAGIINCICPN